MVNNPSDDIVGLLEHDDNMCRRSTGEGATVIVGVYTYAIWLQGDERTKRYAIAKTERYRRG